jgi:flavin-dependent dehydrogenase
MRDNEKYDVVVIGGGIGGSVSAIRLAKEGKKVLQIEKDKTPRHKTCSGIQFPYFEKLLGVQIPKDLTHTPLTKTQLTSTEIDYPPTLEGKKTNLRASFPMSNFMRNTFDKWLNTQAIKAGAEFHDKTKFVELTEAGKKITIKLNVLNNQGKPIGTKTISSKYVIAADGVNSSVRKQFRPQDFVKQQSIKGAGINYYIKSSNPSKLNLNKETLYQIYNTDYNNSMFAWVYIKDEPRCNEANTKKGICTNSWVVGTAYDGDINKAGSRLLKYVKEKYGLEGEILRTEKINVELALSNPKKRFAFNAGKNGNILLIGDAAGLIDPVRGLGMDASALSAQKAVSSIFEHEQCEGNDCPTPAKIYTEKMEEIKNNMTKTNLQSKQAFKNNEDLSQYLKTNLGFVAGMKKIICSKLNMWRKPENMKLC